MASHICMYVVECICLVSANVHLMTVMIKRERRRSGVCWRVVSNHCFKWSVWLYRERERELGVFVEYKHNDQT